MTGDMTALQLVLTGDPGLFAIVRLSLLISLSAVLLAALVGVPVGALLALARFRGREVPIVILNALMGLPPRTERVMPTPTPAMYPAASVAFLCFSSFFIKCEAGLNFYVGQTWVWSWFGGA